MQVSIIHDIKVFIKSGNMVTKLILLNLAVTVFLFLINIVLGNFAFSNEITKYFLISDNYYWDLTHPWVFITHLFISNNIIDLIWNMFILYWFGAIVGDMIGDDKVLPVYIMGGVFGALTYIIFTNVFGIAGFRYITGCNTAILSIAVASAVLVPNYNIRLFIFGNVTLKIIVIIYVLLQLVYAYTSFNDIFYSLIGGIVFGWFYIYSISKSWRLDSKFNNVFKNIISLFSFSYNRKQNKSLSVKYKSKGVFYKEKNDKSEIEFNKNLDDILKKIKETGYDSLSDSEKEFLFLASKKQ